MADNSPERPLITAADLRERQRASRERVRQVQARAEQARTRLAEQRTTATSQNHAVTLTVDAAGTLVDLHFAAAAAKLSTTALAETVLRTYRHATTEAVARTQELLRDVVGADSPALDAIRATVSIEEDL